MKSFPCETGSSDWAELHVGVVSAGESENLFTPKMRVKEGGAVQTYLHKKAAEVFRGMPLSNLSPNAHVQSQQMFQGQLIEEEVLPWWAFTNDVKIISQRFCTTDDGLAGCTPDGMVGSEYGLEIKAPEPHTHVGYLLGGVLPECYAPQVHFSMFVTGLDRWVFVSYRKNFPALVVSVDRDEEIMKRIGETVAAFHAQLKSAVSKLQSLK